MPRVTVKRQDALCMFYRSEDSGQFFAVCCAGGFMKILGRKVRKGEAVEIELKLKEIQRKSG